MHEQELKRLLRDITECNVHNIEMQFLDTSFRLDEEAAIIDSYLLTYPNGRTRIKEYELEKEVI